MSALDGIHITRWGQGPRIVLVHGGARGGPIGGAATFAAQRPIADAGYELVLPDRPGHGASPAGAEPEDMELDAVWVAELLGDGAHLVGHSYGGAIALSAAARRPAAVRSLTMIEPPVFSVAWDEPAAIALAQALAEAIGQPDELRTMLAFVGAAGLPVGLLAPQPDPGEIMAMARGLKAMREPVSWDATPALDAVATARIPALLVTGGWNPGFEVIADRLAARLSGRHLTLAAGHHLPHLAGTRPGARPGVEAAPVAGSPPADAFNAALLELLGAAGRH